MEKSREMWARFYGKFLDATEYLAYAILFRRPKNGVTVQPDVRYGEGKREVADIILPPEDGKKHPIMIYIHGGGWISGVKNMRRTYCYEYASRGYFVANVDYDLAPDAKFPVAIQQCLNAVDYVFDNAEKYNLDTTKILLAGESAGAYYVGMIASIAKNKEILKSLGLTLKHTEFDVTVNLFNCGAFDIKGMAAGHFPQIGTMLESFTGLTRAQLLSGEYDEIVEKMSPVTYVNTDFPPTFMLYATHDALRGDSFEMKKRLDLLGVDNGIYKCDGLLYGNHAFPIATITKKGQVILAATLDFIDKYIPR